MEPTKERLHKEFRAIYRGWERAGFPKTVESPILRLAKKYSIPCQRVRQILDLPRWHRPKSQWLENRQDSGYDF